MMFKWHRKGSNPPPPEEKRPDPPPNPPQVLATKIDREILDRLDAIIQLLRNAERRVT